MRRLSLMMLLSVLYGCQSVPENLLIEKGRVGFLDSNIRIKQLDSVFQQDSVVRNLGLAAKNNFIQPIAILAKDGTLLLGLEPVSDRDLESKVESVQIFDPKFRTKGGIGLSSTYKEIRKEYPELRVLNTVSNVILSIDELNATIALDKKELPGALRYDTNIKIELYQIPDETKVKHLLIRLN